MKKIKYRRLAAMAASLLCCLIFTVPAYAQSSEPQPETAPSPAETEAEPETQNPFTPDGTGTVVDNATDEDGKEFYTITTADESVFYLVIDKQKTSENVYSEYAGCCCVRSECFRFGRLRGSPQSWPATQRTDCLREQKEAASCRWWRFEPDWADRTVHHWKNQPKAKVERDSDGATL